MKWLKGIDFTLELLDSRQSNDVAPSRFSHVFRKKELLRGTATNKPQIEEEEEEGAEKGG